MTQRESCLVKIQDVSDSLTPKERQLAHYVLEHGSSVINMQIDELSEHAGVSASTVIRLCKTLGYSGYKELCRSLYADLHSESSSQFEDLNPGDKPDVVLHNIAMSSISAIENTVAINDKKSLSAAVDLLCRASRIDFYGLGTSGLVALDASSKFIRLSKMSYASTEKHNQIHYAITLKAGDVAVLISYSGETGDIVNLAKEIRPTGANIISITKYGRNTLSELADIRLYVSSNETLKRSGAMSSRIAQLMMLDTLYSAVCSQIYDEVSGALEASHEAIERIRSAQK